MTKLLVSVRSGKEAQVALAAGAQLIDVKEPSRGALGAADGNTIEAVVSLVAGRAPTSAALGELVDANWLPSSLAERLTFAKFGLAGCASDPNWRQRLQESVASLPRGVVPVAVAYADWERAVAPQPEEVLAIAQELHCGGLLVDTFDKTCGPVVEHISFAGLDQLIHDAQCVGMLAVVAGGLRHHELPAILALQPDYIGVRGAVCCDGRESQLDGAKVRELLEILATGQCRRQTAANR
jgi:uncharacterized protein (UPF0264 family)